MWGPGIKGSCAALRDDLQHFVSTTRIGATEIAAEAGRDPSLVRDVMSGRRTSITTDSLDLIRGALLRLSLRAAQAPAEALAQRAVRPAGGNTPKEEQHQ